MLYALVLAIGRDPLPRADVPFSPTQPAALPAPERLQPVPGISTRDIPPVPEGLRPGRVTVPIAVHELAPSLRSGEAGVATFHSITGGDFRWYPLDEAIAASNGDMLVTADTCADSRLTITFATRRDFARHGYLARAELHADVDAGGSTAVVTLRADAYPVRFDLPQDIDSAGPLRLQRVDDRQWLPMQHNAAGLTLRRGRETVLELGRGEYELQDPLAPGRAQRFTVPGTDEVEVSAALAPARGDRE